MKSQLNFLTNIKYISILVYTDRGYINVITAVILNLERRV